MALAQPESSVRLSSSVRVGAIRDGLIIGSSKGCFRIIGPSAEFFVSELIPRYRPTFRSAFHPVLAETATFIQKLSEAGIVSDACENSSLESTAAIADLALPSGVFLPRHTALTDLVADLLLEQGIQILTDLQETALVFSDFSGLGFFDDLQLAHDLHKTAYPSFSYWRNGSENFYGPFANPGRTACWHCFRQRFSDSLQKNDEVQVEDHHEAAKIITDNLLLILRCPDVVPWGCVLVDDGDIFSAHSVLPVPWCDVCNFVDSSVILPVALAHSEHIPEDLRPIADPRGGIVRHLFLFANASSEMPAVPSCASVRIASRPNGISEQAEIRGEGKGATLEDAVRGAIGEGIERYAASLWHSSDLVLASYSEIQSKAFDPRSLVLYDNEQFAQPGFLYAPFDSDQPLYWTAGKWLDTDELVYLPALATYMNFPASPADRFTQTSSNGLAAGSSLEDATLRALLELIERDAFMLFWIADLPATRIETDSSDELVQFALVEVARLGANIELYCVDAGTGHPTVVCIGFGDGRSWPGVTVGLGTHANIDVALRKAVFEHNHYGSYIRQLMVSGVHKKIRCKEDVKDALDHGLYYIEPSHADGLDSFRANLNRPVQLRELRARYQQPATVKACISCLLNAGIRSAAVEVTSPDVRLAHISVVRAFGTWMQPIHFGAVNWRLNNPRLQRLLVTGANTTPHPVA